VLLLVSRIPGTDLGFGVEHPGAAVVLSFCEEAEKKKMMMT
jgi:hypothetical protein